MSLHDDMVSFFHDAISMCHAVLLIGAIHPVPEFRGVAGTREYGPQKAYEEGAQFV